MHNFPDLTTEDKGIPMFVSQRACALRSERMATVHADFQTMNVYDKEEQILYMCAESAPLRLFYG